MGLISVVERSRDHPVQGIKGWGDKEKGEKGEGVSGIQRDETEIEGGESVICIFRLSGNNQSGCKSYRSNNVIRRIRETPFTGVRVGRKS